jgi:hypothetical protein
VGDGPGWDGAGGPLVVANGAAAFYGLGGWCGRGSLSLTRSTNTQPEVTPATRKPDDESADLRLDRRATWPVGVGPSFRDQRLREASAEAGFQLGVQGQVCGILIFDLR